MLASTSAQVQPLRIPVRNAWHMLLYAWNMAEWKASTASRSEVAPTLLGLVARLLADSTDRLTRHQLQRSHLRTHGVVHGVRGRIEFGHSIKQRLFSKGMAACAYPELSLNTLRNQILRSTLLQLATDTRVDSGNAAQGAELRARLRGLSSRLDGVSLIRPCLSDFSRIRLNRNDGEYRLAMALCELISRHEMPAELSGDHLLHALMKDETKFAHVFELFIRNFFRLHLPQCNVRSECLPWHGTGESRFIPEMRTDTTIELRQHPRRRLVIDTKFKHQTLVETRFGSFRIRSGDLYQIYAYLRTQEHLSPSHRSAIGVLLYPTVDAHIDDLVHLQEHKIHIRTVDLTLPWQEIEGTLVKLAKSHLYEEVARP